jgi:CRP-like cAMP-binding protein
MQLSAALQRRFLDLGRDLTVEAHGSLLRAGEVAKNIYLVQTGAVRLCLCDDKGAEINIQFFFEGEMVSSLESMLSGCPSGLDLIAMEPCTLKAIDRDTVLAQMRANAALQAELLTLTQQRMVDYVNLYASAISQTPTQRYVALQTTHKDKLARIPQHVLASFLGVTPVHLSRIRRQLKAKPASQGH